jgi:hypothetical protein
VPVNPSGWPPDFEERVLRCDVCARPFLLAYRTGDVSEGFTDTVIRATWVSCPWPECHQLQPVVVPMASHSVVAREWLGSAEAASSEASLRDFAEAPGEPVSVPEVVPDDTAQRPVPAA